MKNILIVEKEKFARKLYEEVLKANKELNIFFSKNQSAKEIIKEVEEKKIDIILTEMFVPSVDVPKMITRIKEKNPGIKVIIATTKTKRDFEKEFPELLHDAYVEKPFAIKILMQVITTFTR